MTFVITGLIVPAALPLGAQDPERQPPVIDVHMHAPMSPGTVEESMSRLHDMLGVMDSLNVRFAVLTAVSDLPFAWNAEIGDRVGVLPSLLFPCENGVAVMHGRPCFEDGEDWPDLDRLRGHIEAGRVQGLGEIATQFLGLGPSDPAMEPYFALAEEYDLPVFIHMLPGGAPVAYEGDWPSVRMPNHRGALGNPLLLEDALVDEMISILRHHPQVYAEVGLLHVTELFPRAEYYALLRRLVRAGLADRILFGSDAALAEGVSAILEADVLPGLRKWTVNLAVHVGEPAPYDAITEFWFADQEALQEALASEEVAAALRDGDRFVAPPGPVLIVAEEHAVIGSDR